MVWWQLAADLLFYIEKRASEKRMEVGGVRVEGATDEDRRLSCFEGIAFDAPPPTPIHITKKKSICCW